MLLLQSFLLPTLLIAPHALEGQSSSVPGPTSSPRSAGTTSELSAEEIFSRFAGRILFLTCDESASDSTLASGVVVSADGFIVTNAHVVEGCGRMTATYISETSRQSFEPLLKYYDEKSDIAVIKIEAEGLDFFQLPSRSARVGERVYAIGNPRGLEQSISEGIVSGRRVEDGMSWIQHSAPISPGSSGGALLSSRGELLGINSFLLKESQNLNFAVPAATVAGALSTAQNLTGTLKFPAPLAKPAQAPTSVLPQPQPHDTASALPLNDPTIQQIRDAAVAFTKTLTNYAAIRHTTRYRSDTASRGRTSWQAIDIVTSDVVAEDGVEQYWNIRVNPMPVKKNEFGGHGLWLSSSQAGLWSEGELASALLAILSSASDALLTNKRATTIVNRPAYRYEYSIEQTRSSWQVDAYGSKYRPAYSGTIWIDRETSQALRIEMSARQIPTDFPLDQIESTVDYGLVLIGGQEVLLPIHSEALSCVRGTSDCSRNVIDFRNYGKLSGRN